MKRTLLIIDDDTLFGDAVAKFFFTNEIRVATTHSGKQGLAWCEKNGADVILLDQKLPDGNGLDLCQPILATCEHAKIIFITAYPSFDHAVQALRNGAYDYLSKPMELEELSVSVERAFRTLELERVEQIQRFQLDQESRQNALIGIEKGLRSIRQLVELACSNQAPVLITGETGTGKNVVAKAIHHQGIKHAAAFVGTNCAALPENLIESELFGHEKGAFTDASTLKKGVFEMADGGTLFLDEVGEIPLHLQSKLLGILDDGIFRRVGGQTAQRVEVRIIAATNVDLEEAIGAGRFREDLYYRLSVMRIHLPPLRERSEDIEDLCRHFLQQIAPDQHLSIPPGEIAELAGYSWPGNVRELKNIIERAIILRSDTTIYPAQLIQQSNSSTYPQPSLAAESPAPIRSLAEIEKEYIKKILTMLNHNHTRTAKALGIARSTLIRKIEQYSLKTGDSN
ncbi:MAG: sigma-54 dependent transcriptional regulator [Desulfocapsaceae bacterium]|nr:sigma-54 dependent transcriptional regulator [Desulfocapsaceae bacterium]